MLSLDSRVTCNLFYYKELAYLPETVFIGYLKAAVVSIAERGSGKKPRAHPYFPCFFVPFMFKESDYIFADHFAFEAKDVSTEEVDVRSKQWEFSYLHPPQRERDRLQVIQQKLYQGIEKFVKVAKPLTGKKLVSRTRFLGQFPRPLREGIEERVMYGTIDQRELAIPIYVHDFSSYEDRNDIPRGNLTPRGRLSNAFLRSSF